MTATLSTVRALATSLGATVDDNKDAQCHECRVTAPRGKVWADGVHEFVDCANRPWKPDYRDLIDRMNFGLEVCTDSECEWCCEEISE